MKALLAACSLDTISHLVVAMAERFSFDNEWVSEHGDVIPLSTSSSHNEPTQRAVSPLLGEEDQKNESSAASGIVPHALKPSKANRLNKLWQESWTPEIVSCVLSILSLVAIVIVLALYQNQPIPNWPRLITINSLLSIFSTLLKIGIALPLSQGKRSEHTRFKLSILT